MKWCGIRALLISIEAFLSITTQLLIAQLNTSGEACTSPVCNSQSRHRLLCSFWMPKSISTRSKWRWRELPYNSKRVVQDATMGPGQLLSKDSGYTGPTISTITPSPQLLAQLLGAPYSPTPWENTGLYTQSVSPSKDGQASQNSFSGSLYKVQKTCSARHNSYENNCLRCKCLWLVPMKIFALGDEVT